MASRARFMDDADGDSTALDNFNPIFGLKDVLDMCFSEAVAHLSPALEVDADDLKMFVHAAMKKAKHVLKQGSDPLNANEIAAINLYTQETPVYRTLNTMLRNRDRNALKVWFPYLKLLLTAVHKLKPINTTVYRGVKRDLQQFYKEGDEVVWWSFSSATASVAVLKNPLFLGEHGDRTLFSLNIRNAVNIQLYSAIDEDERLMLPGTQLTVTSVVSLGGGLKMIQLEEDTGAVSLISGFGFTSSSDVSGGDDQQTSSTPSQPQPIHFVQPPPTPAELPQPPPPIVNTASTPSWLLKAAEAIKNFKQVFGKAPEAFVNKSHNWDLSHLQCNTIEKLKAVATMLTTNATVEDWTTGSLLLHNNNIDDKGAKFIGDGVKHSKSLTHLHLDGNNIGDEGAKFIGEGVKHSTSLKTLFLNRNKIDADGAKSIGEGVKHSTSLKKLKLGFNNIGDEGAKFIGEGVKHSKSLEELYLNDSNIGDDGAKLIGEGVKHSKTLNQLYLDGNNIGDEAEKLIGEVVKHCKTLEKLSVCNNNLTDAAKAQLSPVGSGRLSLWFG